ncbi:Crp/Fnr family transcriptional regulator [Paracraurococcus lichenis]|uniref:Crp/Fnr family transcriptional regulator n=1 Tax=Paracraurococcus lichenis TaxID=3064888 RepID=A0ABT9DZI5_9PROT|nr:Crp/Fnr family transcriptional regulator [Paracraurococcus sp. LOR1-02]MDO9709316.1 Crp/Fnr family transcriptional regulator [Paracraurococcus sp. LOR1-02]
MVSQDASARRTRPARHPTRPAAHNRLLAAFPRQDLAGLADQFEEVRLVRGQILFEPGQVPPHVHFPHAGTIISLVLPLRDGGTTETVTVGLEGAVGLGVDAADAAVEAYTRGVVQMPGAAARILTTSLARAAAASPALRQLLARHAEAAMSMALQTAACNAQHPLRARLARWLLTAQDRSGDAAAPLPLTQEVLAEMLSVRRASVGEVALALQAEGLVRLSRGGVRVLDRAGLEGAACECHAALRCRYGRLLPGPEAGR